MKKKSFSGLAYEAPESATVTLSEAAVLCESPLTGGATLEDLVNEDFGEI